MTTAGPNDPAEEDDVAPHDRMAERFRGADLNSERFIDVHDGEKGTHDHTRFGADGVRGNYGIYAGGGLVDIDVDDYSEDTDDDALAAVNDLPETLTVETPHTDGVTGGHRFYRVVPGDEFETAEEACQAVADATNPAPSWGEIRVKNQYVVGPGSQLDGCDKEWCDECATPDGGRYKIADDRPIATITADDLADVLRADPQYQQAAGDGDEFTGNIETDDADSRGSRIDGKNEVQIRADPRGNDDTEPEGDTTRSNPDKVVAATGVAQYYPRGPTGSWDEDDRSRHDYAICMEFVRHGVPKDAALRWFHENLSQSKIVARDDGYIEETWATAVADVREEDGKTGTHRVVELPLGDGETTLTSVRTPANRETDAARWDAVRDEFASKERGTTGYAQVVSSALLQEELHLLTAEDTGMLFAYDSDTGIYRDDGDARVRERLADRLGAEYSRSRVEEVLHHIRSSTYVERDELGGPEGFVCVGNGVIDIRDPANPVLVEHSPEYRFLLRIPEDVDPTSPAEFDPDEECPQFAAFIRDVVREDDRAKLQEYAGSLLHTWGQPYKRAVVCLGPPDSGKSTFLRMMYQLLGETENVANETLHDLCETRWGVAQLYGMIANIRNELSPDDLSNPQRVKELVGGGDPVNAENKREKKFTFVPTQKFMFAANQVPSVGNADDAFYDRWLFVSFPTSVPRDEQVDGLAEDLVAEEATGILNWMLAGYAHLREQGGFTDERLLGEKEDYWQAYGDSVDRFVDRCLEVTGHADDLIAKKDAHAAYTAMCDDIGMSPDSQRVFTPELTKRSQISNKKPGEGTVDARFDDKKRPRCYAGIRFTETGEDYLEAAGPERTDDGVVEDGDSEDTSLDEY